MNEDHAVKALAALAQAMRLRVFRALVVAGPAGRTPGQLTGQLGVPGATLSFHLKALAGAQLIDQQRDGRSLTYRANFARMNGLLAYLTEHCCEGLPCDVDSHGCAAC